MSQAEKKSTPALEDQRCNELCTLLSRASYGLTSALAGALDEVGISHRAYSVLAAADGADLSQIELAREVGLDKTTMVVTIDELEAAGLAKRLPSKTDRRARVIVVTTAGRTLVRNAEKASSDVRESVLEALDPGERTAFMSALSKLVDGPLSKPTECTQSVRRRNVRN